MSFGFSAGDFLAAGKLAADIVSSLKDAGGSKSEYQALILELECLQKTLVRLDLLTADQPSLVLESIKYTALSCRRPLEDFLAKIRKFEQSLGPWAKEGSIRSTVDKIKFAFGHKDDIQRFHSYLQVHVETINLLLSEHGLGKVDALSRKADLYKNEILDKIDIGHSVLTKMEHHASMHTASVLRTESLLNRVFAIVSGDVASSLASLESMVCQACVTVQRMYSAILEIKPNMVSTDARWSFFQAPCLFEDALGRKMPLPSEYDLDLLHAIIRQRFRSGPGALEVSNGAYDVFYAYNSRNVLRAGTTIVPASSIRMAIRLPQALKFALGDQACPMPRCTSRTASVASWGGYSCCDCGVWFDPTDSQESPSPVKPDPIAKAIDAVVSLGLPKGRDVEPTSKAVHNTLKSVFMKQLVDRRLQVVANEIELEMFKYVRYNPRNFIVPSITVIGQVWETIISDNLATLTTTSREADVDYAIAYVNQTKATFVTSPQTYRQFLFALKRYQEGMLSIPLVANFLLLHLFRDEPSLVLGFAKFLPGSVIRGFVTPASDPGDWEKEHDSHSQLVSSLDFSFMQEFPSIYRAGSGQEAGQPFEYESDDDLDDASSMSDSDDDFVDAAEDLV